MFKIVLLALLASLGLTPAAGPPDLYGLSTWYDPCTAHISPNDQECCRAMKHSMANGESYDAEAPTVAVDVGLRKEWLNRRAIVLSECGKLSVVQVTDTGLLYAAGEFRKGIGGLGTLRYWPADRKDVRWSDDRAMPVVADFPREFFLEVVCCRPEAIGGPETTVVWVWLLN